MGSQAKLRTQQRGAVVNASVLLVILPVVVRTTVGRSSLGGASTSSRKGLAASSTSARAGKSSGRSLPSGSATSETTRRYDGGLIRLHT